MIFIIVSFILNEQKSKQIAVDKENIQMFASLLKTSIEKPDHRVGDPETTNTWGTNDLLCGLASLANCSEEIGSELLKLDVLSPVHKILNIENCLELELKPAIKLIWILSFSKAGKEEIMKRQSLISSMK